MAELRKRLLVALLMRRHARIRALPGLPLKTTRASPDRGQRSLRLHLRQRRACLVRAMLTRLSRFRPHFISVDIKSLLVSPPVVLPSESVMQGVDEETLTFRRTSAFAS
jgi:hypothetical protein